MPRLTRNAAFWIHKLDLQPHPEGGYYRQVYRAAERVPKQALPDRYNIDHVFSTAIYFLLDGAQVSALHRIKSDEIWHFYEGSSLTLYMLDDEGMVSTLQLGPNIEAGEVFQVVIPAETWFGAVLNDTLAYALVGCTVAPGFDFADFELADRSRLVSVYPQHKDLIGQLT